MWAKISTKIAKKVIERSSKESLKEKYLVPGVNIIEDIQYVNDGLEYHRLDICEIANCKQYLPVIINIHGGGFFMDSKEYQYRRYGMTLAKMGFAVVNINYRLSHDYVFPSQIEDVFAVLDFLKKRQDQYHLDMNNIFLVGDSAGAYLAAYTMCIITNKELASLYHIKNTYHIKALGLNCGFYDFDSFTTKELTFPLRKELLQLAFGRKDYYRHPLYPYCSVIRYINTNSLPCYIMETNYRSFITESKQLVETLKNNEVPVKFRFLDKTKKKGHVFHLLQSIEECDNSRQIMLEMTNFFKQYINV